MSSDVTRRDVLTIGGLTFAMAAVTAACGAGGGGGKKTSAGGGATTTTEVHSQSDIDTMRTINSLEAVAIKAYQKVVDDPKAVGASTAVSDLITTLQKHHKDHSNLLAKATTDAGGKPFTDPNPVVMSSLQPTIDAMKTEADVLAFAYSLEKSLAVSCQAAVGEFDKGSLNETIMSIGGVEAKHVSLLAADMNQTDKLITDGAYQKTTGAVKTGTGI